MAGRTLTGTLFHPFKREIYTIALTDVLWELAVSFGALRLYNPDNKNSLELYGIGGSEEVTWQPLCAKDDLLWGQFESNHSPTVVATAPDNIKSQTQNRKQLAGAYTFNPGKMLQLINQLADKKQLTHQEVKQLIAVNNDDYYAEYRKFLYSGQFIDLDENTLIATENLSLFNQALLKKDYAQFLAWLRKIPSFSLLHDYVCEKEFIQDQSNLPIPKRPQKNYLVLGEAAGAWLIIENKEIISTIRDLPEIKEFIRDALSVYHTIRTRGETEWILTGQWLEEFARQHHIHPVMARKCLQDAHTQNLLHFYAEGSTPDTRFEKHWMWTLKVTEGEPQLDKVFLYHGDFLMPSVAAVRFKIEGTHHAA
ncbi:MAG: hypothetical protein HC877_04395 [Thioploca sp.]|nr:hypothetical protein [Thioploca sp.]